MKKEWMRHIIEQGSAQMPAEEGWQKSEIETNSVARYDARPLSLKMARQE